MLYEMNNFLQSCLFVPGAPRLLEHGPVFQSRHGPDGWRRPGIDQEQTELVSSSLSVVVYERRGRESLADIQRLVLEGKIDAATKEVDRLYPRLLEKRPSLLFMLKCRQFVEILADNDKEVY